MKRVQTHAPILSGLEIPEADLIRIYENVFPRVARIVARGGGSLEEAQDIFHDGYVILLEKEPEKTRGLISREAYLVGICKKLLLRKFSRAREFCALSEVEQQIEIPVDFYPSVNERRLLGFLEKAGKKCMDLLRTFYYSRLPVSEIADQYGYSSEHSASAQKYKCLEKLKEVVREKTLQYEDFME